MCLNNIPPFSKGGTESVLILKPSIFRLQFPSTITDEGLLLLFPPLLWTAGLVSKGGAGGEVMLQRFHFI